MKEKYGDLHWWPADTVDQIIIGSILTQNTAWKNVEVAIKNLSVANKDNLHAISEMEIDQLREYIRPAGFFNQKSGYLKEICIAIEKAGGIGKVGEFNDQELEKFLISIKGVGRETMQDIMLYAFRRKVFVVDKYTERIFSRIGIIEKGMKNAFELGKEIEKGMKIEDLNNFHGEIVEICKNICQTNPKCNQCFLKNDCNYAKDFTDP
ncbi:MAG: endonuclease [Cuniculiplasma sp.]